MVITISDRKMKAESVSYSWLCLRLGIHLGLTLLRRPGEFKRKGVL